MTTTSNSAASCLWCDKFGEWVQPGFEHHHDQCTKADHYNPTTLRAEVERLRQQVIGRGEGLANYYQAAIKRAIQIEKLELDVDKFKTALMKIEYGYSTQMSAAEMASIAREALSA